MTYLKNLLTLIIVSILAVQAMAHINPKDRRQGKKAQYRFNCAPSRAETDLSINNVRARLQVGGDLFWDFTDGRYIVPKRDPASGIEEVSSIFAAAVWLGGVLPGDNPSLKLACQDYRTSSGVDFYPGPLTDLEGDTEAQTCREWDRFFRVSGDSITKHIEQFLEFQEQGVAYPPELIPEDVKAWPAIGNPFFREFYDFDLPSARQGLGNYYDNDRDGEYDPTMGDYPIIDIRGCEDPQYPDEMIFFVYNDNGNAHEVTMGTPIRMEVQVQAFGYKTQDEINNMTFYRYKLINRAPEPIDSMFFAMWIDPDLGCSDDDYIGCDTSASLMYVYNEDAVDGNSGCDCTVFGEIVPTYCNNVPILGVDYFRGPLSEPREQPDGTFQREDLGMTSFTYYNNSSIGSWPEEMLDPDQPQEYYNILNGYWRFGTPYTFGGDGYQDGTTEVRYAFTDDPSSNAGWSMCEADLNFGDRRTLQATGPFRLDPGFVNELIIGVIWLPSADYPCPSVQPLLRADETAQGLFNTCFDILDGPDAPTMLPLELDQEIIFTLYNEEGSNNFELQYAEEVPAVANNPTVEDREYRFQGYRIFQLANENVEANENIFGDITQAREVLQVDLRDSVTRIYNWSPVDNPFNTESVFVPELKVEGQNEGVLNSFSITNDAFASGENTRLVNFKKYYYTVVAYGFNNYADFDVSDASAGQRTPYIVGRNNVERYIVTPRKTAHLNLNSVYGEGLEVTRLDGNGVMDNILMISDETRNEILQNNAVDELTWMPGFSPLNAKIYDPINIVDGTYLVTFDSFPVGSDLSNVRYTVTSEQTGESFVSENPLNVLSEELIAEFGFSLQFAQGPEPGTDPFNDESNGLLFSAVAYEDPEGANWYSFVREGSAEGFNFHKTDDDMSLDFDRDPDQVYAESNTGFYPFILNAYDTTGVPLIQAGALFSPSWFNQRMSGLKTSVEGLGNLNNVDIVFTSNKEDWSRCVVVQGANYVYSPGITEDYAQSMDLIGKPSVGKDALPGEPNVAALENDDTEGFAYFPGYAIDVETGQRLNIYFSENTIFDEDFDMNSILAGVGLALGSDIPDSLYTGDDMIWNPNPEYPVPLLFGPDTANNLFTLPLNNFTAGGSHYIFVTNELYDGCERIHEELTRAASLPPTSPLRLTFKANAFRSIAWSGFPILTGQNELLSYADGLIPNDMTVSLRVKNSFQRATYTGNNSGFNQYRIKVEGKESSTRVSEEDVNTALDLINVVPNPYYGGSNYERSALDNVVKITNLPQNCTVTIYSLDGKFIRQYDHNVQGVNFTSDNAPIPNSLYPTDVQWDLKNDNGILVSSGVYYIHIEAPGLGERVIKWFGVNRKFDPSAIN